MTSTNTKSDAMLLVEKLPDGATWDDLMYEIYARQAIESGLRDSDDGRTTDLKAVRTEFGLLEIESERPTLSG